MLGLALVAFFARVASRWYLFNAGRDAEYELRASCSASSHQLGAAFYRKMPAGEIMSRSTSDCSRSACSSASACSTWSTSCFAFAARSRSCSRISPRLTLAVLVKLPLVVSRAPCSRGLYMRTRENQAALGKMSDVLQANLAGVRVVRSFALEERERERFERDEPRVPRREPRAGAPPRIVGPDASARSARSASSSFLVRRSMLLLRGPAHGGITQGRFLRLLARVRAA